MPRTHPSETIRRRRAVLQALASGSLVGLAGCNALRNELPISNGGTPTVAPATTDTVTTETATLVPANRDANEQFGASVALTDGTALIGAPRDEDFNGPLAGAVFAFERTNDGWSQQTTLAAADGDEHDRFGASVALADTGDTAVIGADGADDPNGENAGAAYVFEQASDGWTEVATLAAADGNPGDSFGGAVALADTTILVSAPTDDDPNGIYAGAAYVFDGSDNSWTQQATLAAGDGDKHDAFGTSVALTGDTALIGAPQDEKPNGEKAGAAYVFEQANDKWTQQAKLTPTDGDADDTFGTSVALAEHGDTAFIGAPQDEHPNGANAGAAYVFTSTSNGWAEEGKLALADGDADDRFGRSITLAGDTALISAKGDDDPNGKDAGTAYVFAQSNDGWTQRAMLAPADGEPNDWFGWAVALVGDTALGTAPKADAPDDENAGAAYVFDLK